MRHATRSFILLSVLLSPATGSLAADRWVSRRGDDTANVCLVAGTPCKTVEHALAVAVSGDSINVARGSYKVRLEVRTSTALAFLGGWDETFTTRTPELTPTILKARTYVAKDKRVIVAIAEAGETIALSIDGFVLSGGSARTCGSVLVGVPALIPCQDGGGGLYVLAAGGDITVTVRRTVITKNRSKVISVGGGAFVGAAGGNADVTFDRTTFTKNKVDYASALELLSQQSFSDPPTSVHALVVNSVITGNRGEGSAAIFAIRFGGACVLDLLNSTVTGNEGRAPRGEDAEGAIVLNRATANITNTILWGNVVEPDDPGADLDVGNDAVANVSYSDVGRSEEVFGGVLNDLGGNVNVDPQLIGAKLVGSSPLIDAGTCTGAPLEDFEGDPRPSGSGCDIGADEFVP